MYVSRVPVCSMYACLILKLGGCAFFYIGLEQCIFWPHKVIQKIYQSQRVTTSCCRLESYSKPVFGLFQFHIRRRLLSFVGGRHVRYVGLDFCFDVRLALIFCAPDLILVGPTTTSRNPSNLQSWHDMSSSLSPRVWKNFQQIPCRKSNGVTLLVSTTPCILGSYIKLDYHKSAQARFPLLTQN